MPYMDEFDGKVTLSKRNHIYYGKTESDKMSSSFSEILTDLTTIYIGVSSIKESVDALASGFLLPSGSAYSLADLRKEVYKLEEDIQRRIYIEASQNKVF